MSKRLKKDLQIMIEEKLGHLFFGERKKDLRLLMLRPIDLIEFSEFAGTNADDILIWVGKTLSRSFMEKFFTKKDWASEKPITRKEVFLGVLESMELMGFGEFNTLFRIDHLLISVDNPLSIEEKENVMAKNLCLIYLGLFSGALETLNFDVEGEEIECVLLGSKKCVYKFNVIGGVFDNSIVDPEPSEEAVSDFLSTL
jgi:predicted hydrocarbon binding protein